MGGQSVTTDASIDPLTYSEIRDYLRLDEGVDETLPNNSVKDGNPVCREVYW